MSDTTDNMEIYYGMHEAHIEEVKEVRTINSVPANQVERIVNIILRELSSLGAYVYHKSKYNSVYIKFNDPELRSLRIGDHEGRAKYRYKWNLRFDLDSKTLVDNGVTRFYYNIFDLTKMINHIKAYQAKIIENRTSSI